MKKKKNQQKKILIFQLKKKKDCTQNYCLKPKIHRAGPACKTRFPESKSWALELTTGLVTFDDQRITFCPFNIIRLRSSDIVRTQKNP